MEAKMEMRDSEIAMRLFISLARRLAWRGVIDDGDTSALIHAVHEDAVAFSDMQACHLLEKIEEQMLQSAAAGRESRAGIDTKWR